MELLFEFHMELLFEFQIMKLVGYPERERERERESRV